MARRTPARTFRPATGAVVPDFAALTDLHAGEAVEWELTTTYLDTADLALLARGVTLHRTHGGTDDGWVLELPVDAGGTLEQVTASLSGGRVTPPRQLRELVLALTLGESFVEVASLRTRRSAVELSSEGRVVAMVADDRVAGEDLHHPRDPDAPDGAPAGLEARLLLDPDPETVGWREWLLVSEDDGVLDDVAEPMSALAEPLGVGTHADRLRRVLGDTAPVAVKPPKRARPGKPARRVVHRFLLDQLEAVRVADLDCRRREPEGVHDLRVALRRLRSALATFRPLLDRDVTEPLREQMREISHLLGDARDAEVVGARLARLLDDEPADLRLGAARRTIGDDGRSTLRLGRRTAEDTLRSEEYVELLRGLRDLAEQPPWTEEAEEPADDVLPSALARDLRRLRARIAAVDDAEGSAERARLLHEARKAAKRLRYACEAAAPVLGDDVRRLRRATKDLQEVLGEHHDTMATRSVLRRLAGRGDLHPGTAFTLGRLHAREEQAARRLEREVDAVWSQLDRPKVTGWL